MRLIIVFFQSQINQFLNDYPGYFSYLPTRILNNCILLPIEAESQDTALRIFSTLNDRGKPLSDADIFKAKFYTFFSSIGKKDEFILKWKQLEELCEKIFHPISGTPMDELFTKYMYYERAKMGIKASTTEALRKFYERNAYSLLKKEETFDNLIQLADFWDAISRQEQERFSERVLRRLFVLNYAPNGMWTYFVSVYFMHNKDEFGMLNDELFYLFLKKITAFIWVYALTNPGVNMLRTPVYAEMVNIVSSKPIDFSGYRFDKNTVFNVFKNFNFSNGRPITKSMLAWWALQDEEQTLLSIETVFEIEHIFPRGRQDKEHSLVNSGNLEVLGNKTLLEKRINISASDYRFCDKIKYYKGYTTSKKQVKAGTKIRELILMATTKTDFRESDIEQRNEIIIERFIAFLEENGLTE